MLEVAGLGVVAGMRSLSAPALLSQRLSQDTEVTVGRIEQVLASKVGARTLAVLALGELVADKLPQTPARIAPPSLVIRLLSGAFVGASVARRDKRPVLGPALIGAAGALASSFAFYTLRKFATQRLRVPNVVAGLLEDALTAAIGSRLMAVLT